MALIRSRIIDDDDLVRMKDSLFFAGPRRRSKLSRFWVLLILSGIIASAGVVLDSSAMVIGAMIVAPLMTPLIGSALAFVIGERRMLLQALMLITVGSLFVIVISYIFGVIDFLDFSAATNRQVIGRVNPGLIELSAALATGLVGAFAVVRADVSDTLPGVAVAMSLVPPLAVCGLVLQDGDIQAAFGSFLLFATNASAIFATGVLTLLFYGVRERAKLHGHQVSHTTHKYLAAVVGVVLFVAIPLSFGSLEIIQDERIKITARPIVEEWAAAQGWEVVELNASDQTLNVVVLGPPPELDGTTLRQELNDAGLTGVEVDLVYYFGGTRTVPAS